MQATLVNTESGEKFALQYLPLEIDLGGLQSKYVSAEIPQRAFNPLNWTGTEPRPRSLQCTIEGADVKARFEKLRSWCLPFPGKPAPAIVLLQLGALRPTRIVLTGVGGNAPLTKFNSAGSPTRAKIAIEFQEVG